MFLTICTVVGCVVMLVWITGFICFVYDEMFYAIPVRQRELDDRVFKNPH